MSDDSRVKQDIVLSRGDYAMEVRNLSEVALPDEGHIKTAWLMAMRFRKKQRQLEVFEEFAYAKERVVVAITRLANSYIESSSALQRLQDLPALLAEERLKRKDSLRQAILNDEEQELFAKWKRWELEERDEIETDKRNARLAERNAPPVEPMRELPSPEESGSSSPLDDLSQEDDEWIADLEGAAGFGKPKPRREDQLAAVIERRIQSEGGRGVVSAERCAEIEELYRSAVAQVDDLNKPLY